MVKEYYEGKAKPIFFQFSIRERALMYLLSAASAARSVEGLRRSHPGASVAAAGLLAARAAPGRPGAVADPLLRSGPLAAPDRRIADGRLPAFETMRLVSPCLWSRIVISSRFTCGKAVRCCSSSNSATGTCACTCSKGRSDSSNSS